ncbi:myoneurin-like [Myxocyprinus asiaticus]|uniref:myoneurin-like n=1 Tax=Myxocyprinus asiaticus TaxID=70543 RepID=UPI00222214E7|nr:myoneurin-like [Myxocyprinus asiaticus]
MQHITHSGFLLEQLKRQQERSFLCDCTVAIGQDRFQAHHNVLAAFSEYFSKQCIDIGREDTTITLDPELVNGAVFEKLLTYIYTGDLNMDREEIENFQKAASYLGMPKIVAYCSLSQDDTKSGASPVRKTEYLDPRSPLSPDDYEPLEPISEVEECERIREEMSKEDGSQIDLASMDEAQSSGEQTPLGKRGRKPKARLYEDGLEREQICARGGRGTGRPRGRPRLRPLTSDSTAQSPAPQTPSPSSVVGRGTGRPRGRPRIRPLSTDRADSANTEDSLAATTNDQEGETPIHKRGCPRIRPLSSETPETTGAGDDKADEDQGDNQETLEEDGDKTNGGKTKTDSKNLKELAVVKQGRGRPRIKALSTENQPTNLEAGATNIEEGLEPAKTKENQGTPRKRGRPRSKPLTSETTESSNPGDGGEGVDDGKSQGSEKPADDCSEEGSSQGTEGADDSESGPGKKIRTSTRKRSLSRKLKESQASNEEEDEDDGEDFGNDSVDWAAEEEVKPLQDKLRPICNVCGNLFSELSSLRRHMRIHKGIKPYQCQLCTRSFRQGNQLKTHMRIHTGEKPFGCTSCEARFVQKCQLVSHCRMHHGEEKPHKCDFCEAAFATSSNLKIHIRKHSGEKPYECGECGKRFTQASTLMYHKRRHTGEKPYICDTCGMAFAVSSSLISHNRKHTGVTPYICLDCGKPCLSASELRKHMDIHNGSRKVKCNLCGNTFSDIYSLKKHSIFKHNVLPDQEQQTPSKTDSASCPLNIPIDHQGLIARVRSALVDSPEHEIQMEPLLPPEASLIIQQSAEPHMIIQHADGTEPSMIFQHADSSEAPVIIQHGESGEQVSYVVEQYEIPATAEMEHTQIVIVQTID